MSAVGWAVVVAYVIGYAVAFLIIFRMFAADKYMGVDAAEDPGERVGAIAFAGFIASVFAIFWPLLAAFLTVYRVAVAPKRGRS